MNESWLLKPGLNMWNRCWILCARYLTIDWLAECTFTQKVLCVMLDVAYSVKINTTVDVNSWILFFHKWLKLWGERLKKMVQVPQFQWLEKMLRCTFWCWGLGGCPLAAWWMSCLCFTLPLRWWHLLLHAEMIQK